LTRLWPFLSGGVADGSEHFWPQGRAVRHAGSTMLSLLDPVVAALLQPFAAACTRPTLVHAGILLSGVFLGPHRRTVAAALSRANK
jgi:hypothetical protein